MPLVKRKGWDETDSNSAGSSEVPGTKPASFYADEAYMVQNQWEIRQIAKKLEAAASRGKRWITVPCLTDDQFAALTGLGFTIKECVNIHGPYYTIMF